MNAPPVQYTTTSDGYSIAYAVSGTGPPLIVSPTMYSNIARQPLGRERTLHSWAKRFKVITYDSRGQGMSQRGLAADHTSEAYERDLEAVADHLKLQRFALLASNHFGQVAIRFAAKHPERVEALVLHNCSVHGVPGLAGNLVDMARTDWDGYVYVMMRNVAYGADPATMESFFKESTTQADFLKLTDIALASNIESFAPRVTAPVLIITATTRARSFGTEEAGRQLASLIPQSRLVTTDDPYVIEGETTPLALIVESFLEEVLAGLPQLAISDHLIATTLSSRELDVLRLIAEGRTNLEIAHQLVISRNTVQTHVASILTKTRVANRAQAAAYATRHGFTTESTPA